MFFVIHFRRAAQKLVRLDAFSNMDDAVNSLRDSQRGNSDLDLELVLLSGDSEETLRRTHSRYFGPAAADAFDAAF